LKKPKIVKTLHIRRVKSSKELVRRLLNEFLEEEPFNNYIYIVDRLSDGRCILLKRPTKRFNFDFEIWVEKWNGLRDKRPSHNDVKDDLRNKQREEPEKFIMLWKAIERIYQFEEPKSIIKELKGLTFKSGLGIELLLKLLKWMFALEDVYYWNYERRGKLINNLKGVLQRGLGEFV